MMNRDSDSASRWEYVDFDLEIGEESEPRKYPVSVRSPEGEAQEEMRFPFDEWEFKDKLKDVEVALLRSGGTRRRIGTPEEQAIQGFGKALFEALIVGDVGTHYRVSWREARRQNKGLRIKLRVRPPELSALPWEFLYDPKRDYLSLSSRTPLVRYPEVPQPIERLTVTPPLRILGMVASPQSLPQLDERHEKRLVEEATKRVQARGLVELTWLEGQTWRDLQRSMRGGPWHIFHFIGHGGFDPETEEGAIALSNEEGRPHLLGATDLALVDPIGSSLCLMNGPVLFTYTLVVRLERHFSTSVSPSRLIIALKVSSGVDLTCFQPGEGGRSDLRSFPRGSRDRR